MFFLKEVKSLVVRLKASILIITPLNASSEFVFKNFEESDLSFMFSKLTYEEGSSILRTHPSTPSNVLVRDEPSVDDPIQLEVVLKKVCGEDGRQRVEEPFNWPYSVFGKLMCDFGDEESHGSAVMIGPHHALTCAHKVFNQRLNKWAEKAIFMPCLGGTEGGFTNINVSRSYIYNSWKKGEKSEFNLALLILDQDIGLKIGWAGLFSAHDSVLKSMEPELTGYPEDKGGKQMWTMSGPLKNVKDSELTYLIDTYAGQGGGGIWVLDNGSPYVLGIHTSGNKSKEENIGTRINPKHLLNLHKLMEETALIIKSRPLKLSKSYGDDITLDPINYMVGPSAPPIEDLGADGALGPSGCHAFKKPLREPMNVLPDDPEHLFNLAHQFMVQPYDKVNYMKAFEHFEKAANQGHACAQYSIAVLYKNGDGVPENDGKAIEWLIKAAAQNHSLAQYEAGICYQNGKGVPVDMKLAVDYFRKSANQNNPDAQVMLADCYRLGMGITINQQQAYKWYARAAHQGNHVGQYGLGLCYSEGIGTMADKATAREWYVKSANQGNIDAKKKLASKSCVIM